MIQLRKTLETARDLLQNEGVDFALIGGFALGAHGIHRATKDIDLLVDGTHARKVPEDFLDFLEEYWSLFGPIPEEKTKIIAENFQL